MNNKLFYSVAGVLLVVMMIAGSTYAFYSASANSSELEMDASALEVIYTGGTSLDGEMPIVATKEEGYITELNIKVGANSTEADATLFIHIDEITQNLAIDGFKWYVVGTKSGNQVYTNSGNFFGKNATNNNTINIVEHYHLTTANTVFTLYMWLDGNMIDNSILGGSFSGYVGASTEQVSGVLS